MKQDILFIGVGQAGSNIANELRLKGFQTFYINSTNDDVALLDIPDNLKFHIPGATGCGRNRAKALSYTRDHFETIDGIIMTKFPMFKHIYFTFSTGGGTGSGISPVLLSILSQKYPDKNFGYVAVLPNSNESIDIKSNSLECFSQLQKLEFVNNSFFLDNNSSFYDYLYINSVFAEEFEKFINVPLNKSKRGNVDYDEIEKLIKTKGNVVFAKYSNSIFSINPIFTKPEKNAEKAFTVHGKEPITEDIMARLFSKPTRIFNAYNENIEHSYAGMFGLNMPTQRILEIQEEVLRDNEIIKKHEEEQLNDSMSFIIPENLKSKPISEKKKVNDVDIANIFASFS